MQTKARNKEHILFHMAWDSLPDGILAVIARTVWKRKESIASGRLACRSWAAKLAEGVAYLDVEGEGPPRWSDLFCSVKRLRWTYPSGIAGAGAFRRLRRLDLFDCYCVAGIEQMPALTSLNISGYRGDPSSLPSLPLLKHLDVSDCWQLTDAAVEHISRSFPALKSVDISWCANVTDSALGVMPPGLVSIQMSGCEKITNAGVDALVKLQPGLTSIDLSGCTMITDDGLGYLARLQRLSTLDLYFCDLVTDDGLITLSRMTTLTSLDISGCENITSRGVDALSQNAGLASVSVYFCTFETDAM
jgi:hypothetical protein